MSTSNTSVRPPIVAVLGHVDHGKTSLLDKIRNTSIAAREAGGITQSIGAWQVTWPPEQDKSSRGSEASRGIQDPRKITFIDTPGHAAFNNMRSRGAKLADIAILVVAADDGPMPQTKESLEYLREAQTPFIVAITKVDLPTAQVEVVKGKLAQEGVLLEGRGGDIVAVEVSSQTGQGINELLEMLSLTSELLELKANPEGSVEAVVVETERDARRGPVVSCVVKDGTLKVGSLIGAEGIKTKVRGLFDENGKSITEALPGTPTEVLGFDQLPPVGAVLTSLDSESKTLIPAQDNGRAALQRGKKREGFWIILKADTAGSLEAIRGQLGEKVGIAMAGVGDFVESDVDLSFSTNSPLVGFNTRIAKDIQKMAGEEGVKIYNYKIIYELLADVEKWQKELEEAQSEKVIGRAQVIAQFPHEKNTRIAGCKILEGRITKNDKLRLVREDKVLGSIRLLSLKQQKQEIEKVDKGEFGAYFEPQLDFRIGDTIEAFLPPKTA